MMEFQTVSRQLFGENLPFRAPCSQLRWNGFFPLRDWRTETDLWHHPRKYLVPAIMILIAGGIIILKAGIWLWLLLLLPECALFALYPEDRMSARRKAGQDI